MPDTMMRTWARASDFAIRLPAGTVTLIDLLGDYKVEKGITQWRGTVSAYYGECTVSPEVLLSLGVTNRVAIAVGVLDQLTTAGTVPRPTARSFPWLWKWEGHLIPEARESATDTFTQLPRYIPIVIRSQRKVRFNESLFIVFDNLAGNNVVMTTAGNILLKE